VTTVASPVAATAPESPFPGLTHYTSEYAEFFFGRDAERMRIIGNLQATRLTLLYAQSGVGKSSLLSAGVAPRLRELAELNVKDEGRPGNVPVVMREWVGDPTERLIEAVAEAFEPYVGDTALDLPAGDLEAAIEAATVAADSTLLVILDQFEEYFNYHANGEVGVSFADQLAACINRPDLRANFLIAIREDAYSRIGDLLKSRVPSVYSNYVHLDYLDRQALHDSITKSIAEFDRLHAAGEPVTDDPELVDTVLDQVAEGTKTQEARAGEAATIDAAFVQLVMKRLWKEEAAAGSHRLRVETLNRLGGAAEIIRTHLDEALATLSEEDQDTAATAFRYLVTPDLAKVALGTKALSDWTGIPEARLEGVLSALAAPDLKVLRPVLDARSEGRRYEIFHDGLAEPILSWRARHGDPELRKAQREAAEASRREARERRLRWLAVGALSLVLAVLAFSVLEYVKATRANAKAASVDIADRVPFLRTDAGLGPGAAALVGVEAYRVAKTFEARSQVLAFLQANPGIPTFAVSETQAAQAVAFLPHSRLASVGSDGTLKIWDASNPSRAPQTIKPLAAGRVANLDFTSLAVSPNGQRLAVGTSSGRVVVFDTANMRNRPPTLLTTSTEQVNALAFSDSGALLAAGDTEGDVYFWDVTKPGKGKPFYGLRVGTAAINALGFCPRNAGKTCADLLAVASGSGTWQWDPLRPRVKPVRLGPASLAAAWSPGGSLAYSVDDSADPGIRIIPHTGAARTIATADLVRSLAFADDGTVLVSGGDDWNVTTWDVATGRPFGPPRTQAAWSPVNDVAVSSNGRTIAAAGTEGIDVWPLNARGTLATTVGSFGYADERSPVEIWGLAVGAGGQVAAASGAGVFLWRPSSSATGGPPPPPLTISNQESLAVAYYKNLLAAAVGTRIVLWQTGTSCDRGGQIAASCRVGVAAGGHQIYSLAFNRTGTRIASGGFDGKVTLWNVANPRRPQLEKVLLKEQGDIHAVAFSPKTDILAVAGQDGSIQLWSVPDQGAPTRVALLRSPHGGQAVDSLAFSPDGRLLASGGDDQQVIFWRVDAKKGLTEIRGITQTDSNSILALAFSSTKAHILATGDDNGRVCLYDVGALQPVGSGDCLLGHWAQHASRTGIWGLEFAPDGKSLLTAGIENQVLAWSSILWSADRTELDAAVCKFTIPPLTANQWSSAFYRTSLAHRKNRSTCA
jgi:WD40 repeat protein